MLAAGYFASMGLIGSAWGVMVVTIITSSGVGLAYGAMPALIMSSAPITETAAANGFNTLMRSLGTSIGSAVIGVILSQMTTTMGGHTLASEAGFRTALLVGGGLALISAGIAAVIPAARTSPAGEDTPDQAAAPEQAKV